MYIYIYIYIYIYCQTESDVRHRYDRSIEQEICHIEDGRAGDTHVHVCVPLSPLACALRATTTAAPSLRATGDHRASQPHRNRTAAQAHNQERVVRSSRARRAAPGYFCLCVLVLLHGSGAAFIEPDS